LQRFVGDLFLRALQEGEQDGIAALVVHERERSVGRLASDLREELALIGRQYAEVNPGEPRVHVAQLLQRIANAAWQRVDSCRSHDSGVRPVSLSATRSASSIFRRSCVSIGETRRYVATRARCLAAATMRSRGVSPGHKSFNVRSRSQASSKSSTGRSCSSARSTSLRRL
jgi:hypothetical protein